VGFGDSFCCSIVYRDYNETETLANVVLEIACLYMECVAWRPIFTDFTFHQLERVSCEG